MASKNTKTTSTPATRASTRTKTPAPGRTTAPRTTRAASKTKDVTQPADLVATPVTPARKPLWNRDNAHAANTGTAKKPAVAKPKVLKQVEDAEDAEREPIKVCRTLTLRTSPNAHSREQCRLFFV
jgi:hypothetical protein